MGDRAYTDTELMTKFPEHPWRWPVPLRFNDRRRSGYGCRFCLYRIGLLPHDGLCVFDSQRSVLEHIEGAHE
jgi:hypothetical protein